MRYFLDWEFDEDGIRIEPMSLGIVCQDGRELYIEFDVDLEAIAKRNPWVAENVIPYLTWKPEERLSREQARDRVIAFISSPDPEFWGYYADYDWVCFAQLFGKMVDLPSSWPMLCMDLQQWWIQLGKLDIKPTPTQEHHALADARWNFELWEALDGIASEMRFPTPCIHSFTEMATMDPRKLRRWILSNTLSNSHLTFALEALGQTHRESAADLISKYLSHESPIVREGAIYGLENVESRPDIYQKIKEMSFKDPSPGVRSAASDLVAYYSDSSSL